MKEDDAVWGDPKIVGAPPPPPATELRWGQQRAIQFCLQFFVKIFFRVTNAESHMRRDGAFVATILCDAREEEMEENMEQVGLKQKMGMSFSWNRSYWVFKKIENFRLSKVNMPIQKLS